MLERRVKTRFFDQADQAAEHAATRMRRIQAVAAKYPEYVTVIQDSVIVSSDAPEDVQAAVTNAMHEG